ncbi:uncharacterized protein LOC110095439 isoform X1 [Dendrobium catenatum]|uniref:uncharacterized protein LOC110095439 isoform X1 n=1 Tax=Dendrobium catenatum TaxID=906689 RepID=UPI0009F6D3F7|nr:uncharacterized protein LOC110095439 isoform X1 [Dendrobium catenatum]
MDSMPEIIEISSDEDEGAGVGLRVPEETKVQPGGKRKGKDGGGNDLRPGGSLDESDDDDCLILDGVPESVAVGTEYVELGGEMLDEMLIVGEKGQFACRDYPHPRYLCATFLFSMTPHRKHCDMCHCYVCDCPAPCIYWANHCSSTHKEQSWRVERQLFRRRKRDQQLSHRRFDLKPAFASLNRPVPKLAPSFSSPNAKAVQRFHVKTSVARPNPLVSKPSPSPPLLPNEPIQLAQATRCREPPHVSQEIGASRPKDILCEIYKNCPTVISCRRRIPPPLQPAELSDTDQDG